MCNKNNNQPTQENVNAFINRLGIKLRIYNLSTKKWLKYDLISHVATEFNLDRASAKSMITNYYENPQT